jgi:hypothetical protein
MVSKYFNKKMNGYDSKKESSRAKELKLLEKNGYITELCEQVTFELQPSFKINGKTERAIKYIADFTYKQNGKYIVEDVKGFKTDIYKIKRKMLLFKYQEILFIET